MSTTYSALMGDRGRLVIPAPLRASQHWDQGVPLLFVETPRGVLVTTREQMKSLIRDRLTGPSLADELIAERRDAARAEDAA